MTAPMTHLSEIIHRGADRWPDRIALQGTRGADRLSYGELSARVARAAARLRADGLRGGDRVLLVMDSSPAWPTAFFATIEADLTAVPVPGGTPAGLVGLLAHFAGVAAGIHDEANRAVADVLGVPKYMPDDLAAAPGRSGASPSDPPNPLAVLAFTSGSTARPRAVALGHANLLANLRSLMAVRQAADDETLLSVLPPSHLYELVAGQLAPLAAGARIVYGGPPLPNRLIDTIAEQRVTQTLLVPALVEALAREVLDGLVSTGLVDASCIGQSPAGLLARFTALPPDARDRLGRAVRDRLGSSLRTLAVGGAAIDPAWADLLRIVDLDLDVGYGLTEAGPLVSLGMAGTSPRGSVGRPLPGVEVRIDDRGEVLVSSDAVMQGYAGDAAGTADALAGGWLHTGDRGRMDASGFLTITGRIKEAIVTPSGETLYPEDVEPHYASPHFVEHCVVPVPGADGNDRAVLVVVTRPDEPGVDLDREFATLRAAAPARCRVATMVQRTDPLPRTALGKIRRRLVADALAGSGVAS